MRIGVITFPGSLDDRDAARAVRLAGAEPVGLWHGDRGLRGVDAVILPGGFSYGDYLRCGAIALSAAHDLSDGGLAVALAESCLRGGTGYTVRLPEDPFTALFSESAARAVVAVRPGGERAFGQLAEAHGVPAAAIGSTGGDSLTVDGCFAIPLAELAAIHTRTLPALFGSVLPDPVVPG